MTPTIESALAAASARLTSAGITDPARDARLLMAEALGVASDRLTLIARDPLPAAAATAFDAHIEQRAQHRPVAQILGRRAFWGRVFAVTGDVLDPRPETECLIAAALEGPRPTRILDLGTGSGAILLTLLAEWPEATGVGTDTSPSALAVAAGNARGLGVAHRAAFISADWTSGVDGRFDLVVSNPPYIPADVVAGLSADVRDWEPHAALTAGPSGLEAYCLIADGLARVLAPGGRALLEFGEGQGPEIAAIFAGAGFANSTIIPDLDGRGRVIAVV